MFTGYQLIEGTPLWSKTMREIDDDNQAQNLAAQLVQFLTELHAQPVFHLDIEKRSTGDIRQSIVELYNNFKEKLFPYMNDTSRVEVAQSFEDFISKDELFHFKSVLIHGDFGSSNILWDSTRKSITGIIDFGETEIGDPAYDFAGLLSSYGGPFVKRCLRLYPDGDKVLERMNFYKSTFALQEALHGITHNDLTAFENGMKGYR